MHARDVAREARKQRRAAIKASATRSRAHHLTQQIRGTRSRLAAHDERTAGRAATVGELQERRRLQAELDKLNRELEGLR